MKKFLRKLVYLFSKKFREGKKKTFEIAEKSFFEFVAKNKIKIKKGRDRRINRRNNLLLRR